MADIGALPGPWNKGATEFSREITLEGGDPRTPRGGVPTETQRMSMLIEAYVYRLNRRSDVPHEYYAVNGIMRHGIQHSEGPYNPHPWWLAVGYYVDHMGLSWSIMEPQCRVYEQGPNSTVGQASTSYSIGGGLNAMVGDMNAVGGSVNASFGQSYTTPAVTIAESTVERTAQWMISLPAVGFQNDPNPKEPSYAGYEWNFGIIFQCPVNVSPTFNIRASVSFHYDNTRGHRYDTKIARVDKTWKPDFGS